MGLGSWLRGDSARHRLERAQHRARVVESNQLDALEQTLLTMSQVALERDKLRQTLADTQGALRDALAATAALRITVARYRTTDDRAQPGERPTERQWVNAFLEGTDDMRLSWAAAAIAAGERADLCFQVNHENRIHDLNQQVHYLLQRTSDPVPLRPVAS